MLVPTIAIASPALAAPSPQVPLPGSAIPQFVQPLPLLSTQGGPLQVVDGTSPVRLTMCEFKSRVLPIGTLAPAVAPETWVWGYVVGDTCPDPSEPRDTYLGPVVVAVRGQKSEVTFVNQLGSAASTNVLAYRYSTDQTLHWADPLGEEMNECNMMGMGPAFGSDCAQNYAGPVPAVPHLHGGEVPPNLDGGPDQWFTSDGAYKGHGYYTSGDVPANGVRFDYPNTQEAGPLWFHDHTLGATRLNVYAGLAGGYMLVDPDLSLPANLQGVAEVVPLIIQDRMFDTNGQLLFQAGWTSNVLWALNPEHPYWSPEFVGDTLVVNGKAWPYLDVQPRRYRFLVLNGSNARTYELSFIDPATKRPGPPMWVIGNDGGYLDAPVKLDPALGRNLVIMPGERYEILVDFKGVAPGTNLILRNSGRTPYPGGTPPQGATLTRVAQFRVACPGGTCPTDASYDPASGVPLRSGDQKTVRLASAGAVAPGVGPTVTRQLTVNEVMGMGMTATDPITGALTAYPGGPLEILVNNTKWGGHSPRTYGDFVEMPGGSMPTMVSESPAEGTTEIWEIVNLTADAHPMHLHLVQFQILNRQPFQAAKYAMAYAAAFPAVAGDPVCIGGVYCPAFGPPLHYATGNPRALGGNPDVVPYLQNKPLPPKPEESGWKDTVMAPPGMVTRLVVRWAPTDKKVDAPASQLFYPFDPFADFEHGYVWHCHIIDHEDNEMMRPSSVQLNPLAPAPAARPLRQGQDY